MYEVTIIMLENFLRNQAKLKRREKNKINKLRKPVSVS